MKRTAKTVSVLVFISLLFFACHSVNIGLAEDGGTADKHPLSAISVLRDLIDEINRLDEEMAQMGYYALPTNLFMKFVEPVEPYDTIDESQLPIQEGSVDLTVAARIEEREFDGSSEFSAVVLLTVNGRMVDFEMDGSRSTDGILIRSFQSNRDYLLPVHADNLPVAEGENEIMLVIMSCCPAQELYLDAQYLTGNFHSDRSLEGRAVEPCPEEWIDRVVTVRNPKDAPALMAMPIVGQGEQLAFESDHRGHTLIRTTPSPTLHFYIDNTSSSDQSGRRAGLMALFVDGQLQSVWDGCLIGEIRLQDQDLMKAVQIKTGFGSGERHSICWHYIETESASEWKAWGRFSIVVETQ